MPPVRQQRRRAQPLAGADQQRRPAAVQHRGERVQHQSLNGLRDRMQVLPGLPGVAEDRQRRDDDQHALDHRGEELRLVVAIGMIGVGRDGGEVQRAQRDQAGGDVDDAFQRIGIQRRAPGDPPGRRLQGQHQTADRDAAGCDALSVVHRGGIADRAGRVSIRRNPPRSGSARSTGPGSPDPPSAPATARAARSCRARSRPPRAPATGQPRCAARPA